MNIIEHFKREADQVLRQSLSNLSISSQEGQEQNLSTSDASSRKQPLVQQMTQDNLEGHTQNKEIDYENQQFLYFASQNKTKHRKCIVCKKLNPKYRCPKCKVEYCNQQHYKSHNLFCTQRFFQQQVQNQMKATKSSKQNVKKMVQILKQNQQQIAKDEKQLINEVTLSQISQDRLKQIERMVDSGKQVRLRPQQIKMFEEYLKQIEVNTQQNDGLKLESNTEQQTSRSIFQQYKPYWLIQEGLSYYLIVGEMCQVQEFNQSSNKQLLLYRQKSSRVLHEKLQNLRKSINFKKASFFVSFDVLQTVYICSLLMRSFNGQYLQNPSFVELFERIYDENLPKMLSQVYSSTLKDIFTLETNVFSLIKSRLIDLQNQFPAEFKLIQSWLEIAPSDCQKIITNKYLTLQTLIRVQKALKSVGQMAKKQNKQSKKQKSRLKLQKKIQFLLSFTNEVIFSEEKSRTDQPKLKQTMLNQVRKEIAETNKYLQEAEKLKNSSQRQKQFKINNILIPTHNK